MFGKLTKLFAKSAVKKTKKTIKNYKNKKNKNLTNKVSVKTSKARISSNELIDYSGACQSRKNGTIVKIGAAYSAIESKDNNKIISELEKITDFLLRGTLYRALIENLYSLRKNKEDREKFYQYSANYIHDFSKIREAESIEYGAKAKKVNVFYRLPMVLIEDKKYDEAVSICETAISYGLNDGTKSGFEGRIDRIRKKQNA